MARSLRLSARKSTISALAVALTFMPMAAQARPLDADGIRATLFGRALMGEYQSGDEWRERFNADGTTDYADKRGAAGGTMRFEGNRLCFDYANQTLAGGCFEVWQRGQNCFDFYNANADGGTEATYTQKIKGIAWDARGWEEGRDKGDCVSDFIS